MKISVIIPTYKPKEYLFECLDSLNAQNLAKSEFEIILILNGCDQPWRTKILSKVEEYKELNISLIQTDQSGVSNARNIGLYTANGEYIAFIDDDDYVSPSYLKSLLTCIMSSPEGSIACSDVRTFDKDGNIGIDYISRVYKQALSNPYVTNIFINRSFLSSSCCKLIPKDIIGGNGFQTDIEIGEDSLFMATISDRILNIIPASSDAIYYRRLRPGSASRTDEPRINKYRRKYKLIKKYLDIYRHRLTKYNFLFFLSRILAVSIG